MAKDGSKNDLAEERTDWAEDRTALANERTFAGWMRTGMASLAIAIGLRAVFGSFEPTWLAKAVASIFIASTVVIFWTARNKSCTAANRFETHDVRAQSTKNMTLITVVLTFGSLAVGVILWLL